VNTVGPDGRPSAANPFATRADPACVPTDPKGNPVTSPTPGQRYARNPDGSYVCDPDTVPERAIIYRTLNGLPASAPVPIDAVTASGSGLDPGISVQNALDQAPRVARARHLPRAR
jgi:potassium-transporting ATPase KdpC subunit